MWSDITAWLWDFYGAAPAITIPCIAFWTDGSVCTWIHFSSQGKMPPGLLPLAISPRLAWWMIFLDYHRWKCWLSRTGSPSTIKITCLLVCDWEHQGNAWSNNSSVISEWGLMFWAWKGVGIEFMGIVWKWTPCIIGVPRMYTFPSHTCRLG